MPPKKDYKSPYITTDIIIEYDLNGTTGLVLITRKNYPYGLAIPGGFAEYGLSLEQNAVKEAMEETGLNVIIQNPEHPFCVHSCPERDPRGHTISIAYIALGYGTIAAGDDAKTADFYNLEKVKELVQSNQFAFDHSRIVEKYLAYKGVL